MQSLLLFPNLRRLSTSHSVFAFEQNSKPVPPLPVTSLTALRHLTRISLCVCSSLDHWALKLLSHLPELASFEAVQARFAEGSEETLAEWLAVSSQKDSRKRKLEADANSGEMKEEEMRAGQR